MAMFDIGGKQVECVLVPYCGVVPGGRYVHVVHTLAGVNASFGVTVELASDKDVWLGKISHFGKQAADGSWSLVAVQGEGEFIPSDKHLPCRVTYRVVSVDGVRV